MYPVYHKENLERRVGSIMARTGKINGEVSITVIDLDNVTRTKKVPGGSKASKFIDSNMTALLYAAGKDTPDRVDITIRDPELREGDTLELVRKSGKAGL